MMSLTAMGTLNALARFSSLVRCSSPSFLRTEIYVNYKNSHFVKTICQNIVKIFRKLSSEIFEEFL